MSSVNRAVLLGHVGRDPEVRYLQSGEPVANFSLATTEKWTDKRGEKQEKTEWHRCVAFAKTAQVVRDYVQRGKQLYVEGSIQYKEYTDKEGNKKHSTEIKVHQLVLLGGGKGEKRQEREPGADDGDREPFPGDMASEDDEF